MNFVRRIVKPDMAINFHVVCYNYSVIMRTLLLSLLYSHNMEKAS